jgi:hypothetical protein
MDDGQVIVRAYLTLKKKCHGYNNNALSALN